MISFDEVGEILDDIADELPREFYTDLNGGVCLLPNIKIHPQSKEPSILYTLGEYHSERDLGKYINIFYGSYIKVYSALSVIQHRVKLREILIHEFTHHLEFLAGENGLEIKDRQDLARYLN